MSELEWYVMGIAAVAGFGGWLLVTLDRRRLERELKSKR